MTTVAELDQEPAGTGTETTVGADKAPASAPPADIGHEADSAELDLLDADDGEEGEEGADAGAPRAAEATDDADRPAWQRPEGLDGDDLIKWKERQGLPADASGYEVDLKFGEGQTITETGQQLINGLKDFAVANDLPPPAVNGLVQWYDAQIKAQRTRLADADKALRTETRVTLQEKWGDQHAERIEVAREGARVLPKALRAMLNEARTPDGRRIAHTPELAEALFEVGRLRTRKGNTVPPSDDQRLAQISHVMNTDIDRYQREGLDKEYLALMRKRNATGQTRTPGTLTAAEAQEESELVQMMHTDIDAYAHRPYRGSGRPAADRLLELRRKRAGEAA